MTEHTLSVRLLSTNPCPVIVVEGDGELLQNCKHRLDAYALLRAIDPDEQYSLKACKFRGVGIDRLAQSLKTGIDVEPTNAVIYAARFDKAVEYGEFPKVILAIDGECLDRTYREVSADADSSEIMELKKTFPTELKSQCGTKLWLSRLAPEDRRLASPYECDYAWWIPGEALRALRAVLIFTDSLDKVAEASTKNASQHSE